MRRISEKNKFPHFDLTYEYQKIEAYISEEPMFRVKGLGRAPAVLFTVEDYVNQFCFKDWNLRGTFFSVREMRRGLQIEKRAKNKLTNDEEFVLDFLQYAINIVARATNEAERNPYVRCKSKEIQSVIENIRALAEQLNTHFEEDEETGELFLVYNDELSDVIAQNNFELKHSLVEYKRTNNRGNLERKAEILCTLSKRLEDEGKKLHGTEFRSLYTDTTFLLNNAGIRHSMTKDSKSRADFVNMDSKELEVWYDRTYEMLLSCLAVCPYIDIKQEIKKLKDTSK